MVFLLGVIARYISILLKLAARLQLLARVTQSYARQRPGLFAIHGLRGFRLSGAALRLHQFYIAVCLSGPLFLTFMPKF